MAQIAAAELGVDPDRVFVIAADTTLLPYGNGTGGSRVAANAGPSVARTAREVAGKARRGGRRDARVRRPPTWCWPRAGRTWRGCPSAGWPWASSRARRCGARRSLREARPGLQACGYFAPETVTFAFGAQACAVEVDVETGRVRILRYLAAHDCGRAINPMIVDGQLHGGLAGGHRHRADGGRCLRRRRPAPHREPDGLRDPVGRRPARASRPARCRFPPRATISASRAWARARSSRRPPPSPTRWRTRCSRAAPRTEVPITPSRVWQALGSAPQARRAATACWRAPVRRCRARRAFSRAPDHGVRPITVSVIQHRLESIVQEMGEAMLRTAYSQILNSSRDFSTAVFDGQGRLAAQAEHVPIHVGALPWAVASVADFFKGRIAPGDLFLLNDPYHGNNHLPDLTVLLPVFVGGRPVFWSINRAHQHDIGGRHPRRLQPGGDRDLAGGHPHHAAQALRRGRAARRRAADGGDQRAPPARLPGRPAGHDRLGPHRRAAAAQAGGRLRPRHRARDDRARSSTGPSGRAASASAGGRTASSRARRSWTTTATASATSTSAPPSPRRATRSSWTSPTRTTR